MIQILRKEVNFGCPVPGCGRPFLEWHHFDPPFAERPHHEPSGMIGLCPECHRAADAGAYSREKLREFKSNPNPIAFVQAQFPWTWTHSIIRLGANYARDWCELRVGGVLVVQVGARPNLRPSVSLRLESKDGTRLASVEENAIEVDTEAVHDLEITPSRNRLKVWTASRSLGVDCSFRRVTVHQFESILVKDQQSALKDEPGARPEPIGNVSKFYDRLAAISSEEEVLRIGFQRRDFGGTFARWHVAQHRDGDGLIPFINFEAAQLFGSGYRLRLSKNRMVFDEPLHSGGRLRLTRSLCVSNTVSVPEGPFV